MSFDCEFDVSLRRRCIEQISPKGIVADKRRAERVLMVLGIFRKEVHPAVTVEVGPRPAVGLEQLARRRVLHHHVASRRSSSRHRSDSCARLP